MTQPVQDPSRRTRRPVAAGVLVAVLSALAGAAIAREAWTGGTSPTASQSASPTSTTASVSAVAGKVDPTVVDVNSTLAAQAGEAFGTGMVLTSSGEILTNNHVISQAERITVTDVGNGRTYFARVVGY